MATIRTLSNKNDETINPATEETMGSVKDAIESLGGSATSLDDGEVDVAVTNTPIAIGSGAAKTVWITAKVGNTDIIVVGGSGVVYTPLASRTGKIMYPGDGKTISIDDLSKIFINGTSGDGVTFSFTN